MRILIISDTHRENKNYFKALEQAGTVDMVVHCGDAEGTEVAICKSADCPVKIIAGNNDFFCDLPKEEEFLIGSYQVWLTHGHNYYVSMGNEILKEEAEARGADIVMYGHTHKPVVDVGENLIAVNPGSLTYPRQVGRKPSYIIMDLDEQGKAHFEIRYL